MSRSLLGACLVSLFAAAPGGERIEARYVEGAKLVLVTTESMDMEVDEAALTLNGMKLPPEVLEESGMVMPAMKTETTIRTLDEVLEAADGRPVRLRRSFEELRESSVENDESKERTGPLQGRALVLEETDGEVTAELEEEGDDVDEVFLEDHRITHSIDLLLPETEVDVGDSWQVEDEALRDFMGMGSGPTLFEDDDAEEDDPIGDLLEEASAVTAEVRLVEFEERQGQRCAVLAFTIELTAEANDPDAFGEAPEEMEFALGELAVTIRAEGKLWYALGEGRPVAMEQTFDGDFECHFELRGQMEGNEMVMRVDMTGSLEGQGECEWSVPE